MKKSILTLWLIILASITHAQDTTLVSYRLNLVQHPVTKRYGYAFKEQNVKSPIHGVSASAVNVLGSGGSFLIGKKDADFIDWAIPAQYDDAARKFSENVAMVKVNGKVGFIDLYNRFAIAPAYDGDTDIDGFHEGLAAVKKDGKWGYINKLNQTVIPFDYEEADNFNDCLIAAVKKDGKWGAIDISGKVVVPFESKSLAVLKTIPTSNKLWREAKKKAKEQESAGQFDKIMAPIRQAAQTLNEKISYDNHEKLTYTHVGEGDSIGVMDNYGRTIVPKEFNSVKQDSRTGAFIVEKKGKYGLYTYNGGRVVGPYFDSMQSSNNGHFTVQVYGISGWISADGILSDNLLSDLCAKGIETEETSVATASDMYTAALNINPECVAAYNNLALIDFSNKDYNKGMRKLKLAAELDPADETVKKNLEWAKEQRKERRSERWNTGFKIATTIITIGATAYSTYSAISGNTSSGYQDTGGTSFSSSSSDSSTGSSTSKSGKLSYDYYKDSYARFEKNAKSCYDSLNNHTWEGAKLVAMKKNLRDAQKEMRRLRAEARKDGYSIPQSPYETY